MDIRNNSPWLALGPLTLMTFLARMAHAPLLLFASRFHAYGAAFGDFGRQGSLLDTDRFLISRCRGRMRVRGMDVMSFFCVRKCRDNSGLAHSV